MVGGNAAVNILYDATFTIRGTTTGDDGNPVRTLAGSGATTFKADKVTYRRAKSLADHSTAQDAAEFNRATKIPQTVTVETKLEKAAAAVLLGLLAGATGVVVAFTASALGAQVGTQTSPSQGGAIVENVEWDYAGPSTLRFTLRQYGTAFVENNT